MKSYAWSHRRVRPHPTPGEAKQPLQLSPVHRAAPQGVIYYNAGTTSALRLLVSLNSLRRYYAGPVTILSDGEESHSLCIGIAAACGADFKAWSCPLPPGRRHFMLAKTCVASATPYDISVFLETDTLVRGEIDELFDAAAESSFCVPQFSNWRTDGRITSKRIREWTPWLPSDIEPALRFGPAVNTGVFAFQKDALFMRDWAEHAQRGRSTFLPDEICCQVILHRYPHRILESRWNCSCRFDDPWGKNTRIIHYHGRKHCRTGLPYAGVLWMKEFTEVLQMNLADVRSWYEKNDRWVAAHMRRLAAEGIPSDASPHDEHEALRTKVETADSVDLVIGSGGTNYAGWIMTQQAMLDATREHDWKRLLGHKLCDRLLAEHVFEHMNDADLATALRLSSLHLKPGGYLRIAVPDGLHPSRAYIEKVKPGGRGRSAHDHKQLFTYQSLKAAAEAAGLKVNLLEYWDEAGVFHKQPWRSEDGHIKRSADHDRRNRNGTLAYTSLILDALKIP
jgi:predicted SAM-dependent methyltransferase